MTTHLHQQLARLHASQTSQHCEALFSKTPDECMERSNSRDVEGAAIETRTSRILSADVIV